MSKKYLCVFEYDKPIICWIELVRETEHNYVINRLAQVMGTFYNTNRVAKRGVTLFDTLGEALEWAEKRLEKSKDEFMAEFNKAMKKVIDLRIDANARGIQ